MQFYPQSNKGFVIDHDLADNFGILDEYLIWEEEYNEAPLLETFEEKFGVGPDRVRYFEYSRGGEVQGLQGFEYDLTYVLFDKYSEKIYSKEWEKFTNILEEHDIDLIEGSWSELG
jgi:hypothetical protein